MNKILQLVFIIAPSIASAQQVLQVSNGVVITIQNGIDISLQGGITLENGSSLVNNGTLRLKNNSIANISDLTDYSAAGALSGSGLVIFNSTNSHNFNGATSFYKLYMEAGGGVILNNNLTVNNTLRFINGKINTGPNFIFLNNNSAASLENDVANTGYANSWLNGNLRRSITGNTSIYDFPVGNTTRNNLLQFVNNNLTGAGYLTASFGAKPGGDAGLNVMENGANYIAVNNGGVWYLTPGANPSGGNYALQLYFNGFTALTDNLFGILRRNEGSNNAADWKVAAGSALETYNGLGRKVSDGFARRINISTFSQLGIGMLESVPGLCTNCPTVCTYSQGFYSNKTGKACYKGGASLISSTQLMLNAFGSTASIVFGNAGNRRFFTLYQTDISNGNILKMLPGSGNSQALAVDNILPYNGATYSDPTTWYLVPIPASGSQKGKINNQLLSQLMTLWFNLRTSSSLAAIDLSKDTLITRGQTTCSSGVPTGNPVKFGLPHNVVLYLNGGNGYTKNVNGLFQLANDVLGGVNTTISALDAQNAVAAINNAFDGCRILTGTLPYLLSPALITRTANTKKEITEPENKLTVTAFPNPYNKQFSLRIMAPVSGKASIEFFDINGSRIFQMANF